LVVPRLHSPTKASRQLLLDTAFITTTVENAYHARRATSSRALQRTSPPLACMFELTASPLPSHAHTCHCLTASDASHLLPGPNRIVLFAQPQPRDDDTAVGSNEVQPPSDDDLIRAAQPITTAGSVVPPAPAKVSPGKKQKKSGKVARKLANLLSGGLVAKAEAKVTGLEQVCPPRPPSRRLTHFWVRVGGRHAHMPQPAYLTGHQASNGKSETLQSTEKRRAVTRHCCCTAAAWLLLT
jgi:hypothetical protein